MLLLHRRIHLMPVLENDLHIGLGQRSVSDGQIVILGKGAVLLA